MDDLDKIQKSAFTAAKNIIEHIEFIINDFMQKNDISLEDWQQNGEYTEVETLDGRACYISYKRKVFHRFRYNALGVIS